MKKARSAAKEAEKISTFFNIYRDTDSDSIGPEGVERLCADLGLDPADRRVLLLAWKMGAQRMGYFSRGEFESGARALKAADAKSLRRAALGLEDEVAAPAALLAFATFAFKFCLTEPRQKVVDRETAAQMLHIALPRTEPHLEPFTRFLLEQSEYKVLSLDQWVGFLRFTQEVAADCSNYDENTAWPLLLDNYVEWRRREDAGGGAPMEES
ncbi:hypothetical protein WJX81_000160 [Elliptochloris bilobata]|uniref:Defective in cullin neddylation protein n=1 Tax=Elliptochloris bilobata TaxID=381761 RepID=A0AAW1RWY4_9CHLO